MIGDPKIPGRLYRWWRMLLCPSQAYFWTKDWQEGYARALGEEYRGLVRHLREGESL